jgi:hypothetical protein
LRIPIDGEIILRIIDFDVLRLAALLSLLLELHGVRVCFRQRDHLLHVEEDAELQRVWPESDAADVACVLIEP